MFIGWLRYCFIFAPMITLNDLIKSTGLKKEYIIKRTLIPRNKFYKALNDPTIFTMDEITRLAELLKYDKNRIIEIIYGSSHPGLDNR